MRASFRHRLKLGLGGLTWASAWALLAAGAGNDLAIGALLLVLATTLSAACWPLAATGVASAVSWLAFNWLFVPPRGSLEIELHQHALLLVTLAVCGGVVAWLLAQQRQLALSANRARLHSDQLRDLVTQLRDSDDPLATLAAALHTEGNAPPLIYTLEPLRYWGEPSAHQRSGLQQCAALGSAFGPQTGRHDHEPDWYLPLRGRTHCHGAACVQANPLVELAHVQALCDQAGLELERLAALAQARRAEAASADQQLRSTLLAAIAHDHRTPLASILTAVSSLREQGERLDATQRERLAAQIQGEAEQLVRITENSLQLARLGEAGADVRLRTDWESPEELVGSVLQRLRRRDSGQRIKAYVEPQLPLVRCDAVLIVQLLDNLLDNALHHGGEGRIELRAELRSLRRPEPESESQGPREWLWFSVRDRGPGIPKEDRERLFEPFQRGELAKGRGAGIGLALCRTVAQAHGGRISALAREGGGCSFELELPLHTQPNEPTRPAD